jgi:radical SAM superfamily enzyme YgiQ (UPF0313 family)
MQRGMPRILLVSPRFDSEFTRATGGSASARPKNRRSLMVPLHLATVAALTPDDIDVDIYDESILDEIHPESDFASRYDLIGVTGYIAHLPRAREIAAMCRGWGVPVVMGGPGVTGSPDTCRGQFDVLLLGEVEQTWPRFIREWKKGSYLKEYRQVDRPELAESPLPRWNSVAGYLDRYVMGGVQTTRGCPYDCEFCDVIHLFGRKPRHKPIDSVLAEVAALERLGVRLMFMCDDDFIADKKYTKELLRELIPVNNSFDQPVGFTTQLTITLAKDDELMALMADCNFGQVLVGVETPRAASLRETNKVQNLRGNLVDDVRKIQSYGISVRASLMVGFDADDISIFDEQMDFIEQTNVCATNINTLKAYPGTPLWVRLQRENRVIDTSHIYSDAPRVVCNIIPKGMTRIELLENYQKLLERARAWDGFRVRLRAYLSGITYQARVAKPRWRRRLALIALFVKGMLSPTHDLAPEVRKEIRGAVGDTLKLAPHKMAHAIGLIAQQTMDSLILPYLSGIIQKQIDECRNGTLALDTDPSAGLIPAQFYKRLGDAMPLLYERLSRDVQYAPAVPEVMVDVLKDFLIRWGAGFNDFEPHHFVYLNELCDRHVQRWNERASAHPPAVAGEPLSAERARSVTFVKGLLVAVEQELRGSVRPAAPAAMASLV